MQKFEQFCTFILVYVWSKIRIFAWIRCRRRRKIIVKGLRWRRRWWWWWWWCCWIIRVRRWSRFTVIIRRIWSWMRWCCGLPERRRFGWCRRKRWKRVAPFTIFTGKVIIVVSAIRTATGVTSLITAFIILTIIVTTIVTTIIIVIISIALITSICLVLSNMTSSLQKMFTLCFGFV